MARQKRMTIHIDGDVRVLDMGAMEIWDGADLALLRETLTHLIDVEKCRSVGVDMSYVKYIPSGFFGMLFDWHEKGVAVWLYSPLPHVQNMLWFRQFFDFVANGGHRLSNKPKPAPATPGTPPQWSNGSLWKRGEFSSPSQPATVSKRDSGGRHTEGDLAPIHDRSIETSRVKSSS